MFPVYLLFPTVPCISIASCVPTVLDLYVPNVSSVPCVPSVHCYQCIICTPKDRCYPEMIVIMRESNMARVRWFIPDIIASDILYFRVYVKKDGCDDEIFCKNVAAVDRSCTVGNILPRMGYTVTVEAVYDDGITKKRCVRYNDFGKLIEARTNFSALFLHTINNYVMANTHEYTFPFISLTIHFLLYTQLGSIRNLSILERNCLCHIMKIME